MRKASTQHQRMAGIGIYSIQEAASLTKVNAPRIKRWIHGYVYTVQEQNRHSHPVWESQFEQIDGSFAIGFRDLMEIRFIDAFRNVGVSWKTLRRAAQKAADEFQTSHPFSERRFRTDGKSIFVELWEKDHIHELRDILIDQYAFGRILSPYLKDIEFDQGVPRRWWPSGFRKQIVVDPQRSFGRPITAQEGVPTSTLFSAYNAEQDEKRVANWYQVSAETVKWAVEFERSLIS